MVAVFLPILFLSLVLVGWIFFRLGVDQEIDEASTIPVYAVIFALASGLSVSAGVAVAPHRYWQLTVGILSIVLLLPIAALNIRDVLSYGAAGYGGRGLGEIAGTGVGAFLAFRGVRRRWANRTDANGLSNRASVAILAVCAAVLLLPIRSVTVPPWRVHFVDAQEQPLAGLEIRQNWIDFSVEGREIRSEDIATTDATGFVAFPARVLWALVAVRLWAPVDNTLGAFLHASFGRFAQLISLCPLSAVEPSGTYYLGASLAERLHMTEAEGIGGASDPSCRRLLDQVRLARTPH